MPAYSFIDFYSTNMFFMKGTWVFMKFSSSFGEIKTNILTELDNMKLRLEKEGRDVINFSIGTPDFKPDKHVLEVLKNAIQNPELIKYGLYDSDELISAVIEWYKRRYDVSIFAENITTINGSQEGMAHIAFPVCDRGDIVLVPNPGYQVFSFGPSMAGAELVTYPLKEENNYLIDFDDIDKDTARKAKMMVVSYPNNPVTATADYSFYEKLVYFAKKYDIIIVHDNAYSELVYDGEPGISFLSVPGATDIGIEFNSLSKSYNLTGLRLSFAIGNTEIIKRFKAFRSQIDYGICRAIQNVAIAALNGPQDILDRNRRMYKERRDVLCGGLNKIGWKVPFSKGTMFTWFPIPEKFTSSREFAFKLLEDAGVVCVPGESFGSLGEKHVRMALVQPVDMIKRAIEKIDSSGIIL